MAQCQKCYGLGCACNSNGWHDSPCPECQGSGIVSCCDTAGASNVEDWASKPQRITDKGRSFMADALGSDWESMTVDEAVAKIMAKEPPEA